MGLSAATEMLEALSAGGFARQMVIAEHPDADRRASALGQLHRYARGLGLGCARAAAAPGVSFEDLYAGLHDDAAASMPTEAARGSVYTTLWAAEDSDRLSGLHFAQLDALPRHPVALLIDDIDRLSVRALADVVRLVKHATRENAPLRVIGSCPDFAAFGARAYTADPDTCMMLVSAPLEERS